MGLMAAKILSARRNELHGNVKLMFQPAEEGPGGALPMIEAGLLENPRVDAAFALHLWTDLPVGKIGVRAGPTFAGADEFRITIHGKGGHGAAPHQTRDPIVIAANFITVIQNIVSRKIAPLHPAVVTIASIEGGTAFNIIPPQIVMRGTYRTFDLGDRVRIRREIERTLRCVGAAYRTKCTIEHIPRYPPTINHRGMSAIVASCAEAVVGRRNIVTDEQTMGAEDMSFVLRRVPGCYFILGAANERKGFVHPHHSPKFDFDEAALPIGIEMHLRIAERYLNGRAS